MKRRVFIIGLVLVIIITGGQLLSVIASANGWHFGMTATSNASISQGPGYSLVIKDDNSLWAWGAGILGDGINREYWHGYPAEDPVKIMDSVSSVAALRQRTFAITTDGDLYAWGAGALGDGLVRDWERPALSPVRIMDSVVSITAYDTSTTIGNYSAFAIRTDGSLWAWGMGQLGDGIAREMFSDNPAVTPVKIMDSVVSVHTNYDRAFAIQTDGSLWGWGSTSQGLLGCGTIGDGDSYRATPVKIMDSVTSVYIGSGSTMVIKTDGSLWAWGVGAVGDGLHRDYRRPLTTPTKIMDDVIAMSDSKALKSDGSLWTWGFGIIGDGSVRDWERPVLSPVKVMDSVAAILDTAYLSYSMVIKTDGSLWAWGSNLGGQLGDGSASGYDYGSGELSFYEDYGYEEDEFIFIDFDRSSPVMIIDSVVSASTFGHYNPASSFVIRTDGSLWAWGSNESGQLGDGSMERRLTPVKILDGMNMSGSAAGPGSSPGSDPGSTPGSTPQPDPGASGNQPEQPGTPPGSSDVTVPVIPAPSLFGSRSVIMVLLLLIAAVMLIVGTILVIVYFAKDRKTN